MRKKTSLTVKLIDGVWKVVGYLTTYEYAEKHGVREATVRKWIYQGKLDAVQIGNGWWVGEDEPLPPNISKMRFDEKTEYMRKNGSRLTESWHRANGSGWDRRKNVYNKGQ